MIYGVTLALIIIIYLQVKQMLRKEELKELKVYLIIMAIAVLYTYGTILEWNLPKPGSIIRRIYQPVSSYIFVQEK